mgnify:CR=1 FL=1|tara:strand:- start:181 stop:519 length:339 start_codon:yes stop_codon:yes gene_type:complete
MNDLNVNNKVIFSTDYRSPPSGCGTIERLDGSLVLIQHEGCKPDVLGGVYDEIVCIGYDMGEEYEKANEEVIRVLMREGVEFVNDYELAEQHEVGSSYIELDKFIELTRFYY